MIFFRKRSDKRDIKNDMDRIDRLRTSLLQVRTEFCNEKAGLDRRAKNAQKEIENFLSRDKGPKDVVTEDQVSLMNAGVRLDELEDFIRRIDRALDCIDKRIA